MSSSSFCQLNYFSGFSMFLKKNPFPLISNPEDSIKLATLLVVLFLVESLHFLLLDLLNHSFTSLR